ncbi:pilus assembly protein PilZ [Shewanella sp. SNU WT4]|uniref:PilZ domain-containing protein n=1 Tax=Shewanella sp. SNU WT4 TaxID=2590015 RepID=UPI00112BA86C|nr:PilZ domain-containing protein [Shewanella sp. SNU WT4]QDF67296.1 pilus assembly protein PilZ [Shewanella sp. SNU WT4]
MLDLSANFESREQAYKAYMPFIKPMGLFFETKVIYGLGDRLTVSYRLPGNPQIYESPGVVVWINPIGASGGRPTGVGIKLLHNAEMHKHNFDTLLSIDLGSSQLTSTM